MPATNACTRHVIPSCCPRLQPKKWKPYYNTGGIYSQWERMFWREEGFHVPATRSCLFLHLPPWITLQRLDVAWAEWRVNVRQSTGLAARERTWREQSQARLQVAAGMQPRGRASGKTCHLEGLWASGLLLEHQQLSVLSKLHSPPERKGSLLSSVREVSDAVTNNNTESRKWLNELSEQAKVISRGNIEGAICFLST